MGEPRGLIDAANFSLCSHRKRCPGEQLALGGGENNWVPRDFNYIKLRELNCTTSGFTFSNRERVRRQDLQFKLVWQFKIWVKWILVSRNAEMFLLTPRILDEDVISQHFARIWSSDLIDSSHTESVSVFVLQRLNFHLNNKTLITTEVWLNLFGILQNVTFLSPGAASPTWNQSPPRVLSSASM